LSLYLPKYHAMKTYGRVEVQPHALFASLLDAGEWSDLLPGRFTTGESYHGTHWLGGWMGPRAVLDAVSTKKFFLPLPGMEPPVIQSVA